MAERITNRELQRRLMLKGIEGLLESNSAFRKFLWTLFTDAGIFYPTYSRTSPHDTAYMEGRRSLGLEVLHILKAVRPDILGLLEREGNLFEEAARPLKSEDDLENLSNPDPDDGDPDLLPG
jgi:hypothetical protein